MEARALRTAVAWLAEGRRVAAATLVEVMGSAPLDLGATLLVDDRGAIEGSVTGGCVEGALVEEARDVLSDEGAAARVLTYGISDEVAAGVGLTCGGTVRVLVHELRDPAPLEAVSEAVDDGVPAAVALLLDGPGAGARLAVVGEDDVVGGFDGATALLEHNVARDARGFLDEGRCGLRGYGAGGETLGSALRVAIHSYATPPKMVVFGATDYAAALARAAGQIGYRVTIVDARSAFAAGPRFTEHAEVVVAWPAEHLARTPLGERDAVLVLTHDPKFDEPALLSSLRTGVGYIGALGSRRTAADRFERLRELGASEAELERISSPCGLDVGARTPEETAIAVLGEILALRAGRAGGRLAAASGPIHPRASESALRR
jgi:xanthine dehydrogenase accessory factor